MKGRINSAVLAIITLTVLSVTSIAIFTFAALSLHQASIQLQNEVSLIQLEVEYNSSELNHVKKSVLKIEEKLDP